VLIVTGLWNIAAVSKKAQGRALPGLTALAALFLGVLLVG
jgi:hypothetical protein